MRRTEELAQWHLGDMSSQHESVLVHSIESCLRYLQEQAEMAGLTMTAHLISAAALAAMEEIAPAGGRLTN